MSYRLEDGSPFVDEPEEDEAERELCPACNGAEEIHGVTCGVCNGTGTAPPFCRCGVVLGRDACLCLVDDKPLPLPLYLGLTECPF